MIIDTPGQIEAFSQSASGQIITETLGCTFPTVSLYVADTVRCENPNTFMSNMLYSLSILYKSKLPLLIVFNKIDVLDHSFAEKWMKDFDETISQRLIRLISLECLPEFKHLFRWGLAEILRHNIPP